MKVHLLFGDGNELLYEADKPITLKDLRAFVASNSSRDVLFLRFYLNKELIAISATLDPHILGEEIEISVFDSKKAPIHGIPESDFALSIDFPRFDDKSMKENYYDMIQPYKQSGSANIRNIESYSTHMRENTNLGVPIKEFRGHSNIDKLLEAISNSDAVPKVELTPEDTKIIDKYVEVGFDRQFFQDLYIYHGKNESEAMKTCKILEQIA